MRIRYRSEVNRMPDRENVKKSLENCISSKGDCTPDECPYYDRPDNEVRLCWERLMADAIILLKEQGKKQITLQKKHVITWDRNNEFSMRKLYEAICETLLDEGELFIARTDNHEKTEIVFYVAEGR